MGHSKAENPRLGEVKAVLQRLQKISDEPEAAGSTGPEDGARQGRARRHRGGIAAVAITAALALTVLGTYAIFNVDRLASISARHRPGPATKTATGVAPGDTAAQLPTSPAPSRTAEPPLPPRSADPPPPPQAAELPAPPRTAELPPLPPAPQATLQTTLGLMASGHVQAARGELLRMAPEDSADVAWALARSYDPNFLGTLPKADAAADIAEATRWYRAWYAIAVKQGLVADSVPLERIIRSMR